MRPMLDLFDCDPPTQTRHHSLDLTAFMAVVRPTIDSTIARLERKKFIDDPICGPSYSRIYSIIGSAQKRHGHILEAALREGLRESGRHRIWTEPEFAVSRAADTLVNSQNEEACRRSSLPYGEKSRKIQIDVGVDADGSIGTYELKRANGLNDAGKIRSMRRDLICTRLLLQSYSEHVRGFLPQRSDAQIIFYYGRRSIPAPYSLIGTELDDHFGFAVLVRIEAANSYFSNQLHELLGRLK